MSRSQEFCEQCRRETLHEWDPDPVNHVLHLLVSFLLCGFWLPVWLGLILFAPQRMLRCTTCGHASAELNAGNSTLMNVFYGVGLALLLVVLALGGLYASLVMFR